MKDIDVGLKETIRLLNEKGYATFGCCEGHWNDNYNGYWQAYIGFLGGNIPREPKLTGFKHSNGWREVYTHAEDGQNNIDNNMIYDFSLSDGSLIIRFNFKNIDMTREEKDNVHISFLSELLDWAKQLEVKDEQKCLRREQWLKKRLGYFDYEENPEWNSYMDVPETNLDLDVEWDNKWSKLIDSNSLEYYNELKNGRFANGYQLLIQSFKEDGSVQNFYFNDVESLRSFSKDYFTDCESQSESYVEVSYRNHIVTDLMFDASGLDDLETLYLYRALTNDNKMFLSKYNGLNINIRFDIVSDSDSRNGETYQWWFCENDMDFSTRDTEYGRFDFGSFSCYDEVLDEINTFIDETWHDKSKSIICNVKLDYMDEYMKLPISCGAKKHIDYYDFRNILLVAYSLFDDNKALSI